MAPAMPAGRRLYFWLAVSCAAVLVFVFGAVAIARASGTELTAYFDRAVGLYPDSSVRVLGVEVGTIVDVQPDGDKVRVDMVVEDDVAIPADAGAVVVAPSLVSDRYVQLTPAYDGGPEMASGAVIPADRTLIPIELDDLFANLDDLATTLGPEGVNAKGALGDALDTLAKNLKGNGANLNDAVRGLGDLAETFETGKDDLFSTVRDLGKFTEMLAASDAQVDELFGRVADVTSFLGEESGEVDAALSTLATALTDVRGFVDENDELLSANVDKLAAVTKILVDRRGEIAEVLDVGPTGMSNFINAYDAASGTVAVRGNLNELTYPMVLTACRLISTAKPSEVPDQVADTCKDLAPIIDGTVPLPTIAELMAALGKGEPPPLPLPLVDAMQAAAGGGR